MTVFECSKTEVREFHNSDRIAAETPHQAAILFQKTHGNYPDKIGQFSCQPCRECQLPVIRHPNSLPMSARTEDGSTARIGWGPEGPESGVYCHHCWPRKFEEIYPEASNIVFLCKRPNLHPPSTAFEVRK